MKKAIFTVILCLFALLSGCVGDKKADNSVNEEFDVQAVTATIEENEPVENDFIVDGTVLIKYVGTEKSVIVPEGVENIGAFAFENMNFISDVTMPSSVNYIDFCAFKGCTGLSNVFIASELPVTIGDYAFKDCSSLVTISLPDNSNIGSYSFQGCTSISDMSIPYGTVQIGEGTFDGCSNLSTVNIPDTVKAIGSYAFSDCVSLEHVQMPDSVSEIGDMAFFNCKNLIGVKLSQNIVTIGAKAFFMCESMSHIELPLSTTTISEGAFNSCRSLESMIIPSSVVRMGSLAFAYCNSLEDVYIENSNVEIGEDSFKGCNNLTLYNMWYISSTHTYAQKNNIPFEIF